MGKYVISFVVDLDCEQFNAVDEARYDKDKKNLLWKIGRVAASELTEKYGVKTRRIMWGMRAGDKP